MLLKSLFLPAILMTIANSFPHQKYSLQDPGYENDSLPSIIPLPSDILNDSRFEQLKVKMSVSSFKKITLKIN